MQQKVLSATELSSARTLLTEGLQELMCVLDVQQEETLTAVISVQSAARDRRDTAVSTHPDGAHQLRHSLGLQQPAS